jgi:hypothetical protein
MSEKPVVDVDRIDGKPRTVRELITSRKYSVDYYRREYARKGGSPSHAQLEVERSG